MRTEEQLLTLKLLRFSGMSHLSLPASLSVDRMQGNPGASESYLDSQLGCWAKYQLSIHIRKGDRKTGDMEGYDNSATDETMWHLGNHQQC